MAIFSKKYLCYISKILKGVSEQRSSAYLYDSLFILWEVCRGGDEEFCRSMLSDVIIENGMKEYERNGFLGVMRWYFKNGIIDQFIEEESERKVITLKKSYPNMPSTTCAKIMCGFGIELNSEKVLRIYASYGLVQGMKSISPEYSFIDFIDINRRAKELSDILNGKRKGDEFFNRYECIRDYLFADTGKREYVLRRCGIKRSLFFYYWKRFCRYGLTGLADTGPELFRQGKIGLENEGILVINKIQYPERSTSSYVKFLKSKEIMVDFSSISKIFHRWGVSNFKSEFVDTLARLKAGINTEDANEELTPAQNCIRYVDEGHFFLLRGMQKKGIPTDSPGLFILWYYIEKLGIFPILYKMGLTEPPKNKGYSWFDLLLLNIARIFYGISSYSATCKNCEPSIALFSGLVTPPCNDSFLNGLGSKITEKQVYKLRQWLIKRIYQLGVINFKKTSADFHKIDIDVQFGKLRKFSKGPSPKKKICYEGFRPHILWDIGTGCPIAIEFRKASARGTTTVVPFINDYIPEDFKQLFETVYIDSEYTGKNVWQFILGKNGLNADLTACLKQNPFVKKARDLFLNKHSNEKDFWKYYDEEHVYSVKTFNLSWEFFPNKEKQKKETLSLKCVVKKNIKNGKLRCFGSSKKYLTSQEILSDYSSRWRIENAIKDLIISYFLDDCPGTHPHSVDVHFLSVSICRIIYKMIENDLHQDIKNRDNTTKTLTTMRQFLFRQGAGRIEYKNGTFHIELANPLPTAMTKILNNLYKKIENNSKDGLQLLGGAKILFSTKIPYGEEHRNRLTKIPLIISHKNQKKN